jgi:Flp pilus assembly CpaE family ATPase
MAELHVVTAIGDPEFESFVARTLHSQGWSVLFRAVDVGLLTQYLQTSGEIKPLLIYSSDIQGLTAEYLSTIASLIERSVGFGSATPSELNGELIERPQDVGMLMAHVITQGRSPLRHQDLSSSVARRSRVIAIASASHGDGATMTAINCAIELNLLGKKVLLIDAHHQLPAIAVLLDERNINGSEPNRVNPLLEVFELTRENSSIMSEILIEACSRTDFVIVDLGLIPKMVDTMTERRWQNIFSSWTIENADDLWLMTSPRPVSRHSLHQFHNSTTQHKLRPRITFILNHRTSGKRGDPQEEKFLTLVAPLHPHAIRVLPLDMRGAGAAEQGRSILVETNPRGVLRRKYLELASGLIS